MSHSRETIALVCGIWQSITVIEALLQDEVSEDEIIFIVDIVDSDYPMFEYIDRIIRVFYLNAIVIHVEDKRPTGVFDWLTGLAKIRRLCGRAITRIYTAYFTYVANIVLGAYQGFEKLVLVDDGIAHYRYLRFMNDDFRFSPAKQFVDSCGISYSACRIHGQVNVRYVERIKYLHLYRFFVVYVCF